MELVPMLQRSLHELRQQLGDLGHNYEEMPADQAINTMIANMMNILETMYVVLNLPADGFVSMTPERSNADEPDEEASSRSL